MAKIRLNEEAIKAMINDPKLRRDFKFLVRQHQNVQRYTRGTKKPCCHKRVRNTVKTKVTDNVKNWLIGMKQTRPKHFQKLLRMMGTEGLTLYRSDAQGKVKLVEL